MIGCHKRALSLCKNTIRKLYKGNINNNIRRQSNNMDREYESMMIVRNDLSEDELNATFEKVTKRIEKLEGKVIEAKIWAKERPLTFELRSRGAEKKKFNKGCYWLVNFELSTEKLSDLKETIRLEENILRKIILRKEKAKVKA